MIQVVDIPPEVSQGIEDALATGADIADDVKDMLVTVCQEIEKQYENFDSESIVAFKDAVVGSLT